MIPKRAIYYWEGEPMSWLREQSLATFARLNPGWSLERIVPNGVNIPGDTRLARVLRSDWSRYHALSEGGGLYFDTDIVFCKPIPEAWLQKPMVLTAGRKRTIEHIALIGAVPQHPWMGMMDAACESVYQPGEAHNYQALGVLLANHMASALTGPVTWVQPETMLVVEWDWADELWREGGVEMSPLSVGVHWFGGDYTSQDMECRVDEAWMMASKSLIAKTWRNGMGIA